MIKEITKQRQKNNISYKEIFLSNNTINFSMGEYVNKTNSILIFKNIRFFNYFELSEKEFIFNINHIIRIDASIDCIIFNNCEISELSIKKINLNDLLRFDYCGINNIKFSFMKITERISLINTDINNIDIDVCNFNEEFYINNQKEGYNEISIDSIKITESKFNKNFKIHNAKIKKIELDGVDFVSNADFFKSVFINNNKENIIFHGINFDGLAIFEECKFKKKFILKYVTFNGLVQFRKAKFYEGFDLDRTNSEKEMNFYGVIGLEEDSSVKKTSQETYRIIKYNCERTGSRIDSNKYHALELQKKREELNSYVGKSFNKIFSYDSDKKEYQGSWVDWIVFKVNWHSSKFGTSWLRAFIWICITGLITMYFMPESKNEFWNDLFSYMSIIHYNEIKEKPIVFFLNKVSLGYLYYQFVTAVRKDTRK